MGAWPNRHRDSDKKDAFCLQLPLVDELDGHLHADIYKSTTTLAEDFFLCLVKMIRIRVDPSN